MLYLFNATILRKDDNQASIVSFSSSKRFVQGVEKFTNSVQNMNENDHMTNTWFGFGKRREFDVLIWGYVWQLGELDAVSWNNESRGFHENFEKSSDNWSGIFKYNI